MLFGILHSDSPFPGSKSLFPPGLDVNNLPVGHERFSRMANSCTEHFLSVVAYFVNDIRPFGQPFDRVLTASGIPETLAMSGMKQTYVWGGAGRA